MKTTSNEAFTFFKNNPGTCIAGLGLCIGLGFIIAAGTLGAPILALTVCGIAASLILIGGFIGIINCLISEQASQPTECARGTGDMITTILSAL